jgi:hypothetical protein
MEQNEQQVLDMLAEIRIATKQGRWKDVKTLCRALKDYTKVLNQLQIEKLIWYNDQARQKEDYENQ